MRMKIMLILSQLEGASKNTSQLVSLSVRLSFDLDSNLVTSRHVFESCGRDRGLSQDNGLLLSNKQGHKGKVFFCAFMIN